MDHFFRRFLCPPKRPTRFQRGFLLTYVGKVPIPSGFLCWVTYSEWAQLGLGLVLRVRVRVRVSSSTCAGDSQKVRFAAQADAHPESWW